MIIYQGPSMLDGAPIVAIATTSQNVKTGPMVQTWILRADLSPTLASAAGADASVCGDCPQRRATGGACYVPLHQAVSSVYWTFRRGGYAPDGALAQRVEAALLAGAGVRLGAYGDPAAVPVAVWYGLLARTLGGHTGYTHQWRNPVAAPLRVLVMASVDTDDDIADAVASGWRYFAILGATDKPPRGAVECIATTTDRTCDQCKLCDGSRPERAVQPTSVWIRVHGPIAKRFETRGRRSVALTVAA